MESWIVLLERKLFLIALAGYALSALTYLAYILFPKNVPRALPTVVLATVSLINLGIVILRSIDTGRSPMASRYESITFFGMAIGVVYLLTEWRLKIKFGGLFASLISFGLFVYVVMWDLDNQNVPQTFANMLFLVNEGGSQMKARPLMPALQSPWFFWHVSLAFFGYAFFTTGFVLELTSSCITIARKKEFLPTLIKVLMAFAISGVLFAGGLLFKSLWVWVPGLIGLVFTILIANGMLLGARHTSLVEFSDDDIARLRRFTHNQVLFAYPLLMWCLLSGAAWADKAWGTYWGWDAKEIWNLITVLIYACYFHLRGYPRWRGRPASIVHIIGFMSVITTYLMVDYLVKWFDLFSLHVYS